MTIPTGSGSDPFDYSADSVTARLSVDVPADAVNSLHSLAEQTAMIRTNMEASARATLDFTEYLRNASELQAAGNAAGDRLIGAGGNALGAGRNDARPTNWNQNTPGTGAGRETDLDALQRLRETDPRQYANLLAQQERDYERTIHRGGQDELPAPRQQRSQGGGGSNRPGGSGGGNRGGQGGSNRPGSPSSDTNQNPNWVDRAEQLQQRSSGYVQNVIRESGNNRGFLDNAESLARGGRSSAANFQRRQTEREAELIRRSTDVDLSEEERADAVRGAQRARQLSGAAGVALRGAGVAGVAVGGAMAVQAVGERYQQIATQGMQRGGGFGEGLAFESQVRTMALNPFISLEQSRKIMQSAMSSGYTGKEFDTVTEFMAENLKKMNVDVAVSTKQLQENVIKGGQSIAGAQTDLTTAQQLSANPNATKTADQFIQQYQAGTAAGVEAGASGAKSSEFGNFTASVFSEDKRLKDFSSVLQGATSNPVTQQYLATANGYNGSLSGALAASLDGEQGVEGTTKILLKQLDGIIRRFVPMFAQNPAGAIDAAISQAAAVGYNLDRTQAKVFFEKVIAGGNLEDEATAAAGRVNDAAGGGDLDSPSGGSRAGNIAKGVGGFLQQLAGGALDAVGEVAAMGGDSPVTRLGEGMYGAGQRRVDRGSALAGAASTNKRIRDLVNNYDVGSIQLKGADGKEMALDASALSNEGVMKDIASGATQIKLPGSDQYSSLTDVTAQQDAMNATGSGGGGIFELSDQAKQLLLLLPNGGRNQNQVSADTGQDGAQRNDPLSGQGYGG